MNYLKAIKIMKTHITCKNKVRIFAYIDLQ